MRFAYVCADSGIPVFGYKGSSIHIQEVLHAMTKKGIFVDLITHKKFHGTTPFIRLLRIHYLPELPSDRAAREQAAIAANADLKRILEAHEPLQVIYERYSLWSFAAMEYARDTNKIGILEVNAPLVEEQQQFRTLIDQPGAERVTRRVIAAARTIIAVSNEVANWVRQYCKDLEKVHVVPNGVNPDRFPDDQTPYLQNSPDTFTVGFLGTLKPWHGLPLLISAFDLLYTEDPTWRLLIVGDGPALGEIVRQKEASAWKDAIHLTGPVRPEDVPGMLASMDVAAAPYPAGKFYFSPLKLYEYMAAGLPIVASNVGQICDVIQHEINGLLSPAGDTTALAENLKRIRLDHELRKRLGRSARTTALLKHTWDSVLDKIFLAAGIEDQSIDTQAQVGF